MKSNVLIVFLLILISIISCKSSKKELTEQEKMKNEIVSFEKKLFESEEIDINLAYNIIEKYVEFVNEFPKDTSAAEFLFKASEISMNINESENAIALLTRIEKNYKDYSNYPACIFLKAFIFENYIGNLEMAQQYYSLFLKDYPDHAMAKDAEAALMYLGMNDEQLLELFSVMNKYN